MFRERRKKIHNSTIYLAYQLEMREQTEMKRHKWTRLAALGLALALMIAGPFGTLTASAADDNYREYKPPRNMPQAPQWEEREVSCHSGSNTLRGTLTIPKEYEGEIPVAILLHGLNTDRSWCDDIAWMLADNGIASVRFDFDGNGASDGAQENMTISSEVRDTVAILDYVESLSFTDRDNILMVGKSMGAVDAVLAAQGRGSEIKAMCLWYPGFGVADATRHGFLLGSFFNPFDLPETVEAAGYTYGKEFIREAQSLDYQSVCADYNGPVMILHGDADFIAPIQYSEEVVNIFPDCTLQVVPGGYHGFFGWQEVKALGDMLDFFQTHIDM